MKIGRYIDTRYDVLSCHHGEVREAGVRCGDSLFRHQPRLLEAFHALRARRGTPIAITSGFRCAGCQARLRRSPRYRAAARSEHEYNVALDLRPWRYRARPEGGWSEGEKKGFKKRSAASHGGSKRQTPASGSERASTARHTFTSGRAFCSSRIPTP